MIVMTTIASIAVFLSTLWAFGVVRTCSGVIASTRNAVAVMLDESLDDTVREKEARRTSLCLLRAFLSILLRSGLALVLSFLPIGLSALAGFVKIDEVFRYLSRRDVILISSVITTVGYWMWTQIRTSS